MLPTALRSLAVALGLALLWVATDFTYARVVERRMARWEASIERDANGVQSGGAAYDLGTGSTALLLVHGIGDSPRQYHKMAPALAAAGFACRVMRMPGFAEPIASYAEVTRDDWIRAVHRELGALRERHDRVVVVAHSLGGAVTLACLLDDPSAADAAVLIAPLVEVSNRRSPLLSARAWHEFAKRALVFTRVTETPFPIDARDPSERDHPGRAKFTPRRVFDQVFALTEANRDRASDFTTPLVVVLSPTDAVVDAKAVERFYERAASSPKAIRYAKDAGHAIPVDYGWQQITEEIAEFARGPAG